MPSPIQLYKDVIDGLVRIRRSVLGQWARGDGWPNTPDNTKINQLLSELSPAQREVLAEIVQRARDGGIHDTLVYLNDEAAIRGLRLVRDGVEVAVQPFDTDMYYDWTARTEGDAWPEERKA
jgi:hypothetical protein